MKRRPSYAVAAVATILLTAAAQSLTVDQREETIRYVNNLQNADGGFRAAPNANSSSLGATSSCLRALKYFGGRPRDAEGPKNFVRSCFEKSSGGFGETPGAKPDVRSTAMGLMAVVEAKLQVDEFAAPVQAYFAKNAASVADIYIAAAALHAAGLRPAPAVRDKWLAVYDATRHADGSYGKGIADTAGAAITILRIGGEVRDRAKAVDLLRAAQKPDGGFGTGDKSDLSTSYRVMRALYMLEAKPGLARCHDFVNHCRNSDGGYGAQPGQPSTGSTTYFASIILHWIEELSR